MGAGFGLGDWAEEVTWRILPAWMRDEDGTEGKVAEPLRGFIDALKPILNEMLFKWRQVHTLWDATEVPLDQLPSLAHSVGITLDPTKSERLQRSEVFNAAQLFRSKGTEQGYSILAGFEDLLVEAIPLWEINSTVTVSVPTVFEPYFDEIPADVIPLDAEYDDIYAIWPYTLHYKDSYRTRLLRLVFYPPTNPSQDFDPDVASRIASRLLRYKPIHIIIDRVTFDGLRGSSQTWVADIDADNGAAGMWVQTVTGELRASSQPWAQTITATMAT
jgi:phage tail-like protein